MSYKVVPHSCHFGTIEEATLREAIRTKHCLICKLDFPSTIHDNDGYIVSEKEISEFIFINLKP